MIVTIQLRRDTSSNWTLDNPVLASGEVGLETDTQKAKVGNGVATWNTLGYWNTGAATVSSVFGRTGAVTAQTGDYTAAQVGAIASSLLGTANGVATLDATTHIPTAQVPQLSQYNPTGLTGATSSTSYAGGTVTGHPLTGTWSQGQWVMAQDGKIWACVASGTPGTWRRVGQDPWQFFLEDYVKADGKQCLVSTTAGSAVINTTPLSAPAAPVPTTSTTGGTILAGTYQCVTTFVNRWGETVGSTAGPITTTGSTSTITIPAPAPVGNATGWYAYVSQAGGTAASATRQQASGSPSSMGVGLVLTAPPTNTGAVNPVTDSSAAQIFTSTAVDGGKNVMINGGLGLGGPWLDTISTVQSPTQATLASNGAGQGGNVTQAGCAMFFASDDRLAVDQCMTDARAYALVNNNFYQVIGPAKPIGLGTGLFQSTAPNGATNPATFAFNTQIRITPPNSSGQTEKLEGQILGPSDDAHAEFWVSQLPNMNALSFVSFSQGPATADPTYGQQSVIGGPQGGMNFNGSNAFANMKVVLNGINVIKPGWDNSIGIDLRWIAGFRMRGRVAAYAPSTSSGGGVNPSNGWLTNVTFQGKLGIGVQFPNEGNNDDCVVDSLAVEGQTLCVSTGADHLVMNRLVTINAFHGILISGTDLNAHDLTINQWSAEAMYGSILRTSSGAGNRVRVNIVMDGESTAPVWDINDVGDVLYGDFYWGDPFRTAGGPANVIAPQVTGGSNLRVHNRMLIRQVYAAPTYTLGTAQQNPWWETMNISLAGGTTTGILIGPTSATCTTSVGTTTPVNFTLPAGWWVNIQGSVKPTTFNAFPAN